MYKPNITADMSRNYAEEYIRAKIGHPGLTLDNFLKNYGITQHREAFVAAVSPVVHQLEASRGGQLMEECHVGHAA